MAAWDQRPAPWSHPAVEVNLPRPRLPRVSLTADLTQSSLFGILLGVPAPILDANELASLVQPEKLAAQGFLPPNRVSVIAGTDHTGEEAFHVYLVYGDDTPDVALAWSNVKPTVRWVRNEIRRASGEERWPYVRVKREANSLAGLF